MKKLLLCLTIAALPLFAGEVWLGMVIDAQGDSLVLADDFMVYAPRAMRQYVSENGDAIDVSTLEFPYTASLITDEATEFKGMHRVTVKIHKCYNVVEGRLVEKSMQ